MVSSYYLGKQGGSTWGWIIHCQNYDTLRRLRIRWYLHSQLHSDPDNNIHRNEEAAVACITVGQRCSYNLSIR